MDIKKVKIETTAITRNLNDLDAQTGNIYETIVLLSKRSDQIAIELRDELHEKLKEFSGINDNLEEIFENREQIEMARSYEQLPKPTLLSISEFQKGKVYYKNPNKDLGEF
ncbi:MAG: DNA-directed RNA polymerase subunit omega [Bacteroidota bacterium]|jgi:DNA-directed RNA polymerase subunit K/omega